MRGLNNFRTLLSVALWSIVVLTISSLSPLAAQTSYPSRPVTIIVGYPPGSSSDILARIVAEKISASMGQPVVVESKPGASGNVGTAFAARSVPDGYTVLLSTDNPITTNIHLFKTLEFDPVKDFVPITIAATNIICVVGSPQFPPNTLAEVISYAKTNPGRITFGSSGIGSPHHLVGELIKTRASIEIQHAPYRGGAPALTDVLGNHIPLAVVSLAAVLPYVGTDKLKVYAISESERYANIPNVPTIAETLPNFVLKSWLGFMVPTGTPPEIVSKLNQEISNALRRPDVTQKLVDMGLTPVGNSSEAAREMIQADLRLRGEIVKAANLQTQ